MILQEIPLQIYYRIREFCSYQDYFNFMNVDKKNFKIIKSETVYFPLSKDHSLIFAATTFYHRVLQVVKFPGQQIGLTLEANDDLKIFQTRKVRKLFLVKKIKNMMNYKYNLSLFSGIPFLKFYGEHIYFDGSNERLMNVLKLSLCDMREQCLSHFPLFLSPVLKVLEIKNCQIPSNFFQLLSMHCSTSLMKIVLKNQDNDFNIPQDFLSSFACLTTIEVNECPNIKDISPFASVENLFVKDCINIDWKLFSPKNKKLQISNSTSNSSQLIPALDISTLTSLHLQNLCIPENLFTLFQYQFDSLMLKSLTLLDVKTILSVEFSKDLSILNRMNIDSVVFAKVHIPSFILQQLTEISLKNHFLNSTIEAFTKIYRVELIDVKDLVDMEGLGNIPFLHIRGCYDLVDISQLGGPRQMKVIFANNHRVRSLRSLNQIPIVVLEEINRIDWLEIANIKDLTVSFSLTTMSFAKLRSQLQWEKITINNCSALFELSGLEEIPFISIQSCESLRSLLTFPRIGKNKIFQVSLKGLKSYDLTSFRTVLKQFENRHQDYYQKQFNLDNWYVFLRKNEERK